MNIININIKKTQWITPGIIKSIKYKDKLYKKLKTSSLDSNEYQRTKINFSTYSAILRSIRIAKKSYYAHLFYKYKGDIKRTWNTINSIFNKSKNDKKFPDHFKYNDRIITDNHVIANKFNEYFINIGPNLVANMNIRDNTDFKDYLDKQINTNFTFKSINEHDVGKIIDSVHSKSSYGEDGISPKLLKYLKSAILKPFTLIINQILHTGIFPEHLKIARVLPLFKKDDQTIFSNYYPYRAFCGQNKIVYSQAL